MTTLLWSLCASGIALGMLLVAWLGLRARLSQGPRLVIVCVLVGALLGAGCFYVESAFWRLSGLSLVARSPGALGALLAMLLLAAPLEEGAKLLVLWVLAQLGRVRHRADGLVSAVAVAAGFACVESVLFLYFERSELGSVGLRAVLGAPAHLFFAALWGMVLANRARLHLLSITWFGAMLMHGLYDHVVFGRGEGTLAVSLPLLSMMAFLGWLGLRDARRGDAWVPRQTAGLAAPSLRELRMALRRQEHPLMMRWIVVGAFVTTGVVLASLALAIVLGNELGVDFSAADEADMRSNGPLVLLGTAVLAAFPVAGYLVARASGVSSVLEPAMGASLAIAAVVAMLSLAAPLAVVFALAVAPVAFALACLGAWFGISR